MTVTAIPPARYRTATLAAHAYTAPVVRELPPQRVDTRDSRTW